METTIKNGRIECKNHGAISAIDCDCLQNTACNGCFIYDALKDMSTDLSEFILSADTKPEQERLRAVN